MLGYSSLGVCALVVGKATNVDVAIILSIKSNAIKELLVLFFKNVFIFFFPFVCLADKTQAA